ncbi:MAG: ATP-dependent metallopeptidase FtsH/Yme1/Tma family protein [Oscillospiraceae bacterium]
MNNDPKGKNPQDNKPQNGDDGRQGRRIVFLMVAALIATLLINSVYTSIANAYLSEIPYNEFQEYLDKDEIAELEFQSDRIVILTRRRPKSPLRSSGCTTPASSPTTIIPSSRRSWTSRASSTTPRSSSRPAPS